MKEEVILISCEVIQDRDLSLLIDAGLSEDVWIPKSLISDYSDEAFQEGDDIEIEIPVWFATKKDLI
ncbi:MAG: hypothetical protein FVQ79_00100 [Planctomycetes bacterium]|nr:hypothetical protein [Planctomycetota bacterium]